MTEVEKLNAEIVAQAEAVERELGSERVHCVRSVQRLFDALDAKRAAMQPTLLDCEDASRIYKDHPSNSSAECMDAVLTACLERAYKVIEALPSTSVGGYLGVGKKKYVALDDIRRILGSALDGRSA